MSDVLGEASKARVVAISDCDHIAYDEEEAVCRANGASLVHLHCKTEDDLIRELGGYCAVINQYAPFTERVFAALPDLKVVVRYGVGVDNIDLAAASRHKVAVCNVPDYGVQEVAAHALALMMCLTRKIAFMDSSVKAGEWRCEKAVPIRRYSEMTFGIIGMGRIGTQFAKLLQPFGGRIVANDLDRKKIRLGFVESVPLETLLKVSDVVSIHANLETARGLISKKEFEMMKTSAVIINVSRGGIIIEEDLADALRRGAIAAAGIDVLAEEPINPNSPLLKAPNILLTPHMAWYSQESSSSLKTKAAEEAVRYLQNEPLKNQVNVF